MEEEEHTHKTPLGAISKLRQQNLPGESLAELRSGYSSTGSETAPKGSRLDSSRQYSGHCNAHEGTSQSDSDSNVEQLSLSQEVEEHVEENQSFEIRIYHELSAIRDKLKEQSERLLEEERGLQVEMAALDEREAWLRERELQLDEREEKIRQMEGLACDAHDALIRCIEQQVAQKFDHFSEQKMEEIAKLTAALRDKSRENQRLRSSFDMTTQANDVLRKQLQEVSERNSQLERQVSGIQSRLTNLQRRNEYIAAKQQRQIVMAAEVAQSSKTVEKPQSYRSRRIPNKPPCGPSYFEFLGTMMNWLSKVHLSQTLESDQLHHAQHCCGRLLPLVADMLCQVPPGRPKLQLSFLEFAYWSTAHLSLKQQKSMLSATIRRIGEEVYKPTVPPPPSEPSTSQEKLLVPKKFFRSPDLHVRILSTLVILKTLTQVDCLAHAFDALRQDLKEDVGKEIFLAYQGVETVLPFMKPSHKTLCSHAVDVYLQLVVESAMLPHFLSICSSEEWFAASTALLRESRTVDLRVLEKLSIVLQRLSKIKANRKLFESFQMSPVIQEILRIHANPDNPFLSLNLQSILINLTSK